MARVQQRLPSGFMNPAEANRRTASSRLRAFLARTCRAVSLALRALRGHGADYDRRLRALCACDLSELSDAGQAARRQALRELREMERLSRSKARN
jgi:hypothetical protein